MLPSQERDTRPWQTTTSDQKSLPATPVFNKALKGHSQKELNMKQFFRSIFIDSHTNDILRIHCVPHTRAPDLIHVFLKGPHHLCSLRLYCTLFAGLTNVRLPGLPRATKAMQSCQVPSEKQIYKSQKTITISYNALFKV